MAKRKIFEIKVDGEVVDVRYAWNASIRSIEAIIGETAKSEHSNYKLVDQESIKEGFDMVRGHRTWQSDNGKVVKFVVERFK